MKLAIFDLDNTLIAGDSDHAWGEWLCNKGILDKALYKAKNDAFYLDYQAGQLDIQTYLKFSLAILGKTPMVQLQQWHSAFMVEVIEPIILKKGEALIAKHRQQGDLPMIITSTNSFVTAPIAKRLGIEVLLASECEIKNGQYTGNPIGVPCFQEGKVTRLNEWLKINHADLKGSFFYSDSINDLPLLKLVENPVAVDPDDKLREIATHNHWSIISLHN